MVKETYGINYKMYDTSLNLSYYHETGTNSNDANSRGYKTVKNVKCVAIHFHQNRHLISFYERRFVYDILRVSSGSGERREWIMVEGECTAMSQVSLVKSDFA